MNIQNKYKKWILLEAILCTLIPVALLVSALPFFVLTSVQIFNPLDSRTLLERILLFLGSWAGIVGLLAIWYCVIKLLRSERFSVAYLIVGAIGGAWASWDITVSTNPLSSLIICLPVWILVLHVVYMRLGSKRKFEDGAVIWPSGRECMSYLKPSGDRIGFTIFRTKEGGRMQNILVTSSIQYVDGTPVSGDLKREIIARCKIYFEEEDEDVYTE
ncbi:hypothetical protein ACFQPC_00695 [Herminiimonas glaciei]|uniref:DUF5673 domain-containing protein n=1 Tax=Herminiimonas glaciei TaxID=523788 RepID=A0ABW2I6E2_9BURK